MKKPMDEKYKILIGGEWVDSKEKKTFDTYSPINGEFLSTCVDADKESVDLAVKAAWKAFKEWKDISCDERADMLEKLGEKLEEN
ncbi:MAG: aldehyde dehydrogenase family protein, partial [Actinomycetota bacterium]|nr:aldehyde dehydrogenase family protein [Actinomycetota bacterium]